MNEKNLVWLLSIPAVLALVLLYFLAEAFLSGSLSGFTLGLVAITFVVCLMVIALPVIQYLRIRSG